ncbi:MAG TPA: accessory factor UbiK family protein [Sphingomonadales bacterium]
MVQTQSKFFDDLAKLAAGAAGTLHGVRSEVEATFRQWAERWAAELDLVSREEFEAVRAMAVAARKENEELRARLDALELKLGGEDGAGTDIQAAATDAGGTPPEPA